MCVWVCGCTPPRFWPCVLGLVGVGVGIVFVVAGVGAVVERERCPGAATRDGGLLLASSACSSCACVGVGVSEGVSFSSSFFSSSSFSSSSFSLRRVWMLISLWWMMVRWCFWPSLSSRSDLARITKPGCVCVCVCVFFFFSMKGGEIYDCAESISPPLPPRQLQDDSKTYTYTHSHTHTHTHTYLALKRKQ